MLCLFVYIQPIGGSSTNINEAGQVVLGRHLDENRCGSLSNLLNIVSTKYYQTQRNDRSGKEYLSINSTGPISYQIAINPSYYRYGVGGRGYLSHTNKDNFRFTISDYKDREVTVVRGDVQSIVTDYDELENDKVYDLIILFTVIMILLFIYISIYSVIMYLIFINNKCYNP